jgi:hypothetical protein
MLQMLLITAFNPCQIFLPLNRPVLPDARDLSDSQDPPSVLTFLHSCVLMMLTDGVYDRMEIPRPALPGASSARLEGLYQHLGSNAQLCPGQTLRHGCPLRKANYTGRIMFALEPHLDPPGQKSPTADRSLKKIKKKR